MQVNPLWKGIAITLCLLILYTFGFGEAVHCYTSGQIRAEKEKPE